MTFNTYVKNFVVSMFVGGRTEIDEKLREAVENIRKEVDELFQGYKSALDEIQAKTSAGIKDVKSRHSGDADLLTALDLREDAIDSRVGRAVTEIRGCVVKAVKNSWYPERLDYLADEIINRTVHDLNSLKSDRKSCRRLYKKLPCDKLRMLFTQETVDIVRSIVERKEKIKSAANIIEGGAMNIAPNKPEPDYLWLVVPPQYIDRLSENGRLRVKYFVDDVLAHSNGSAEKICREVGKSKWYKDMVGSADDQTIYNFFGDLWVKVCRREEITKSTVRELYA